MTKPSGIVLVLDPDEAGQRAAESSGLNLLDLFGDWGKPRYPGEPTSHAVAQVQRAIDDLGDEVKALESVGASEERLAQTYEERWLLWEYMDTMMRDEKPTVYSQAITAEEYEYALALEEAPIMEDTTKAIDYEAIKAEVDIVGYIEARTSLRKSGKTYRGRCVFPDHAERTASLYVYPDTSSFYCFGCNRGGDVITFAKLLGIPARDIR